MIKRINIKRKEFYNDTTIGFVFIEDTYFSYSLEDTVRSNGIKLKGKTAIPDGTYNVIITHSNRFRRDMIQIYNTIDNKVTDGINDWTGVRIHGGNTHNDTEGCPLVAYKRISDKVIQSRADKDLFAIVKIWIDKGYNVELKIEN